MKQIGNPFPVRAELVEAASSYPALRQAQGERLVVNEASKAQTITGLVLRETQDDRLIDNIS